jgi:uncharacterized lipoprotein YmbA
MKFLFLLPGLFLLTCCGVLSPVTDSAVHRVLDPLVPDRALSAVNPSIAVNRPSLPGYLDRQQLVTRSGGQLVISDFDLWAEPLDACIARVLAGNLSRLTGSTNIQPVENFVTLDYAELLELRISRFEPDVSNHMILEGTWKLQPVTGDEAGNHFFRISVAILRDPPSATARVEAMNRCLERLSRQIGNAF